MATGLLALAPAPLGSPIRKVANYRADPAGPIWSTRIEAKALVRAAEIIPRGATYALVDGSTRHAGDENPETGLNHSLLGGAYLHFLPSAPAVRPEDAEWVIVYRQPLPALPTQERHELAPGVTLLRLRSQ